MAWREVEGARLPFPDTTPARITMKKHLLSVSAFAALAVSASALAGWSHSQIYTDATQDLFDNGMGNLDIVSARINQSDTGSGYQLSIWITTREFADWTKYMVFMGSGAGGRTDNPWNRPIDTNGQGAHSFIGAWADGGGGNQFWAASDAGWSQNGSVGQYINPGQNHFELSLGSFGYSMVGHTIYFDVATSGGGNDPGVDHLSRSDMATSGWGSASTAGQYLSFTLVPAPGAIALFGLAGLVSRRRR